MTPEETAAATTALTQAVQDSATTQGTLINTQAGQLAPGLATGSNAPGGYNYARTIQPTIEPLQANMVLAAKQATFKQALKDAQYVAKTKYEDANYAYKQRQRDYTKKEALEAKARYAASMSGGGSSGGGSSGGGVASGAAGSNVTDVTTSGKQYIGNNDVRGRLSYLASQGDANAKTALQYVGNDNKYWLNPSDPKFAGVVGALNTVGAVNAYKAPAAKTAGGGGGGGGW